MRPEDRGPFYEFLMELRGESDRGLALIGAAFIDEKLGNTLNAFFIEDRPTLLSGKNAPLGTFSSRIETCFALGLIEATERQDCEIVRKIRNEFAHKVVGTSFNEQRIADLCKNFQAALPDGQDGIYEARFRFENAIMSLANRLFYRSEYVAQEKRVAKVWVDPESIRWRKVAEEKPLDGQHVIAYARNDGADRSK